MKSLTQPIKYTLVATITILLMVSMTVFAAPFTPGQILDPSCNPGDTDCYVAGGSSRWNTVSGQLFPDMTEVRIPELYLGTPVAAPTCDYSTIEASHTLIYDDFAGANFGGSFADYSGSVTLSNITSADSITEDIITAGDAEFGVEFDLSSLSPVCLSAITGATAGIRLDASILDGGMGLILEIDGVTVAGSNPGSFPFGELIGALGPAQDVSLTYTGSVDTSLKAIVIMNDVDVNIDEIYLDITAGATGSQSTQYLTVDPITGLVSPSSISAGTDTLTGLSCSNNQIAKWNGVAWICANDNAASGSGGSDTLSTLSCSTNQIAKWDGSSWVCATDANGSGGGATTTNGLSDIAGDIGLGGSLTQDTDIELNGNDITFSNSSYSSGLISTEDNSTLSPRLGFAGTSFSGAHSPNWVINGITPTPATDSIAIEVTSDIFSINGGGSNPHFILMSRQPNPGSGNITSVFSSEFSEATIIRSGDLLLGTGSDIVVHKDGVSLSSPGLMSIMTPAIHSSTAADGQVLTLVDASTGEIEYQSLHELTTNWDTAGRPATPQTGYIGFNTDLARMEYWNGSVWLQF